MPEWIESVHMKRGREIMQTTNVDPVNGSVHFSALEELSLTKFLAAGIALTESSFEISKLLIQMRWPALAM